MMSFYNNKQCIDYCRKKMTSYYTRKFLEIEKGRLLNYLEMVQLTQKRNSRKNIKGWIRCRNPVYTIYSIWHCPSYSITRRSDVLILEVVITFHKAVIHNQTTQNINADWYICLKWIIFYDLKLLMTCNDNSKT